MNCLLLFTSMIMFLIFSFLSFKKKKKKLPMQLIFYCCLFSTLSLFWWILTDCPISVFSLCWLNSSLTSFSLSFTIDNATIMFSLVAFLVTWSMLQFSNYYMGTDPKKKIFLCNLMLFLLLMLILVTSKNLFLLFMGWEGVGILSFILIGWWFTRADAKSAAMQAIVYNRIGDSGFIFFLIFKILFYNTWKLNEMMALSVYSPVTLSVSLAMLIAAAGKSAQLGLHPWLPAAMEGPTPVSALLHSSTMVVAGVFLLYRSFPLLLQSTLLPFISVLGAMTALFAASAALTQFDLKKVIAYSTTSQLGIMIVALGMGAPKLALFHMCTHAFFKSLLFLCSGSLIHSLNKEQDFRKMKTATSILPFTTSCLMMGKIALCGFPFLAGYYSKDLILEATQMSTMKSLSVFISMVATLLTTIYSFRIMFFISMPNPSLPPLNPVKEKENKLYMPFTRLIMGVLLTGWGFSSLFLEFPPFMVPFMKKSAPLLFVLYTSMFLMSIKMKTLNLPSYLFFFLSSNWFFTFLSHGYISAMTYMKSLLGVLRSLDQGWVSFMGPFGSSMTLSGMSKAFNLIQTGNISSYILFSFLMISTFFLLLL